MKKPVIFCVAPKDENGLRFYLEVNNDRYFLFNQRYRSGVAKYFENGIDLNTAITKRSVDNDCIKKVITKIPSYIKYIEKEFGISVLNQTIKKQRRMNNA